MSADNEALVREYYDRLWNHHDLTVADQLLAPYVLIGAPLTTDLPPGPPGARQFARSLIAAFPDIRCQIDHQQSEGDIVSTWLTYFGTNTGPFMGQPPTQRPAVVHVKVTQRVVDGQIVESLAEWDTHDLLRQLGHASV